jgi:hypothetical protein
MVQLADMRNLQGELVDGLGEMRALSRQGRRLALN